jgi:nitrate reductase gamma subunit
MEIAKLVIGQILPYITILVLVVGLAMRLMKWNKAPVGKMTIFPGASSTGEMITQIGKEVLIFRGLFKGNKGLWVGSWLFHAMLAFICVGHIRVVWEALFFLPPEGQKMVSAATGGTFGVIILLAATYLFARRLMVGSVREISDVEDYVALVLIVAIVLTGDAMRFLPVAHIDLATATRPYFTALFTFGAMGTMEVPSNPWFLAHFFLAQLLFLYMPFSKFLHIPGVFYSQALIQKA